MITQNAIVRKGRLVLDKPLNFADGTKVTVDVRTANEEEDPLLWLANHAIPSGVTDGAEEHDHYVYGTPKRKKPPRKESNPLQFILQNSVKTGIPDLAEQHDHYIYGTPKRTRKRPKKEK